MGEVTRKDTEATGRCLTCDAPLETHKQGRPKKYCSDRCRSAMQKSVQKQGYSTISEAQKSMRALAFENLQDEVREVLRQEIRDQITQHVHDNVLGAADAMMTMLPQALAGLRQDLESEDWMARSRAYALLLKYAMAFGDADPNEKGSQNIVVVSGVPTPDTPLGHAVVEQYEQLPEASKSVAADDDSVEDFEKDWPECYRCHQRKPAANMNIHDSSGRYVCTSCQVTQNYKYGAADPGGIVNNRLYGGE